MAGFSIYQWRSSGRECKLLQSARHPIQQEPMAKPTRILFLARRYPPHIGGIETHCYELYTRLKTQSDVRLIANGRTSLVHLAWFIPYCFWIAFWAVLFRRVDAVYFADGVAGSLAPLLRPLGPARFILTVYGLEMTYKNPIARALMHAGARACEQVVVISQNSRQIVADAGVPETKIETIYLGVEPRILSEDERAPIQARFEEKHELRFGQDRTLLFFGRQVRRKGMVEFLEKGMPLLDEDIHLFIGGGRNLETDRIATRRRELGIEDRVTLLGLIPDDELAMLRACCDLFLMPNIRVPGDVEGFGQTQLECMYAGTPVVAFAVDALPESVREGGYLIEPEDYAAFADQIHNFLAMSPAQQAEEGRRSRAYIEREYTWQQTAAQYMNLFTGRT
ncbi:MAG TPA: glycosyltransferase family 1 protein [Candidatus Latescibacteria bacterium]|nr:glycosyltransferase family 1 protein [Candidatus Handelsmanbacteria bacterium]HIL09045.1 glycosyltransferase family 1 protein [Candidatus Latescibacterota bacterium]